MRMLLAFILGLNCGAVLADPVRPTSGSIVLRPMGSDATVSLPYCDPRYAAPGDKCVVRK